MVGAEAVRDGVITVEWVRTDLTLVVGIVIVTRVDSANTLGRVLGDV